MMSKPMRSSSPLASFFELLEDGAGSKESDASAGDDALFGGGLGGVQRVVDQGLRSFISVSVAAPTLITRRRPSASPAAPGASRVVVAGGLFDLNADLLDAALDIASSPAPSTISGVVLVGR